MGSHRSSSGWHGAQWGPKGVMSLHASDRYKGAWLKNREQVPRRTPKLSLVPTNSASRAPWPLDIGHTPFVNFFAMGTYRPHPGAKRILALSSPEWSHGADVEIVIRS